MLVIVVKILVAQIEPSKSYYNCNVRSDPGGGGYSPIWAIRGRAAG